MTGGFPILWRQLTELWGHFGVRQKFSTIFALLVTVIAVGGLLYWSSRPCYRLLCANLPLEEAAKAQEKLEEKRILVKLSDSGHALYVPAGDVYRSRLLLASAGLPKSNGGNVGFEMFAEPKFGLTDFAQQVNYQRALQGELQNTIMAMDGITSARVLLSLPKDKMFAAENEAHPTASVIINVPEPLSGEQVRSLTHLVSAGVPGLRVADITITDQNGRLMSRGGGSGAEGELSGDASNQMEIRAKIEEQLTRKAQRMLDLALGHDAKGRARSTVQVSADLDFSRLDKERETLDSEGRVVTSETISSESTTTPSGADNRGQGQVNVSGANDQSAAKTKKEDINTKYQVPRSTEKIHESGPRIRALSVSVCVEADSKKARTPEELEKLEQMVGNAVGVVKSDTRNDKIKVVEMSFPEHQAEPRTSTIDTLWMARGYASSFVIVAAVLAALFFLRRRAVAGLDIESSEVGMPLRNLASVEGGAGRGGAGNRFAAVSQGSEMELIASIAEQEPKTLATWIASVNEERK